MKNSETTMPFHVSKYLGKLKNEECLFDCFHENDWFSVAKTNLNSQNVICIVCIWYHPSFKRYDRFVYKFHGKWICCKWFTLLLASAYFSILINKKNQNKTNKKNWSLNQFVQIGIGLQLFVFVNCSSQYCWQHWFTAFNEINP